LSAATQAAVAKLLGLLGLAQRAGKLAVGATAVEGLIRRGRRPVVIIATDAGSALHRRLANLGSERCVLVRAATRQELGQALGRAQVATVAVADKDFARGIVQLGLARKTNLARDGERK
jgi:ribosomal protein L7Ae-like RNA K-turn-binding protein